MGAGPPWKTQTGWRVRRLLVLACLWLCAACGSHPESCASCRLLLPTAHLQNISIQTC
jgi:hypothetical protein